MKRCFVDGLCVRVAGCCVTLAAATQQIRYYLDDRQYEGLR